MSNIIDRVPRFNWESKGGEKGYIFLIFRYNKQGQPQKLRMSTRLKIESSLWDYSNNYIKRQKNTLDLKAELDKLSKITLEIYKETNGNISTKEFRAEIGFRYFNNTRPEEATRITGFLQFFQFFISQKAEKLKTGEIKESTMKQYRSIYSKLEKYCQETGQELTLEAINSDFRQSFVEWCFDAEQNNITTVNKYLKVTKEVVKEARERSITNNTFPEHSGWFMKDNTPKTIIALSESELEAIFNLDLKAHPEGYQKARQLFLIGAYTGLRVSDYSRINPSHINTEQGEQVIKITAQKTEKTVSIPLDPNLKAVLEECNYKAPKLSPQKLNDYIKEVARLAGITEERTVIDTKGGKKKETKKLKYDLIKSHTARKTFATISYSKGIDLYKIRVITGHSTEQEFNKYIDKDTLLAMKAYSDLNKDR